MERTISIDPMDMADKISDPIRSSPTLADKATVADVKASASAAEAMEKSVDAREGTTADMNYKTNPIQPLGRP